MAAISVALRSDDASTGAGQPALRDAWDGFVAGCPAGDIVQTTAWSDAKGDVGYRTVLAVHREGPRIVGGAAILVRRVAPLLSVGYVPRGPLAVAGTDPARIVATVEDEALKAGVTALIVQPPAGGEALAEALVARGYVAGAPEVAPSATLVVDLAAEPEAILARMAPYRRRNVRQALHRGTKVRFGGRADLEAFHTLAEATSRRQQFAPLSLDELRAQWDALRARDAIHLVLAEHEDRVLAGIVVTAFGRTVTFRHTGWNGERPDLQPNVACHWFAMQWARDAGFVSYDLGGIERSLAARLRGGESRLAELQRGPAGYKAAYGGALVWAPEAHLKVLNPLLGPLTRPFLPTLIGRGHLRRVAAILRRGSAGGPAQSP